MVVFFYLKGGEMMPINGVPSDDWRVKQAMSDYTERMDVDQAQRCQQKLQKKKSKNKESSIRECEELDFEMPF